MKKIEARILMYLNKEKPPECYATKIAINLRMDYYYICKTLGRMFTYKQIRKIHRGKKIFYELTAKGKKDLVKAKEELTKSSFTKKLIKKIRGI